MEFSEVLFRGKLIDEDKWVEGNYFQNIRKGKAHYIITKNDNIWHEIERQSLMQRDPVSEKFVFVK